MQQHAFPITGPSSSPLLVPGMFVMSPCRAELQRFGSLLAAGAAPIAGYAEQDFLNWRYQVGSRSRKHWGSLMKGSKQEHVLSQACPLVLCRVCGGRCRPLTTHSAAFGGTTRGCGINCGRRFPCCPAAWLCGCLAAVRRCTPLRSSCPVSERAGLCPNQPHRSHTHKLPSLPQVAIVHYTDGKPWQEGHPGACRVAGQVGWAASAAS